jgi:hypothetical protein
MAAPSRTSFSNKSAASPPEVPAPAPFPDDSEADLSDVALADQSDGGSEDEDDTLELKGDNMNNLEFGEYDDNAYAPENRCEKSPATTKIPCDDASWTPVTYLLALLPKPFWANLSRQTNIYADQERDASPVERGRPWTPTTLQEMYRWAGILMIMSLAPLPKVPDFFTNRAGSRYVRLPNVCHIMSRVRWEQIKRYLHLADNSKRKAVGHPLRDRLFHLRPMLDLFQQTAQKYYELGGDNTVDESMVPFKGRSFMKQYIKDKPTKWGFKIWALCCSDTGYFFQICVYAGKGSTKVVHGLATDSVMDVVSSGKLPDWSTLYTDRWFTSPVLACDLLSMKIYLAGTVQLNRSGLPNDLKMRTGTKANPVPQGTSKKLESSIKVNGVRHKIYATTWMDRKPVSFMGTAFGLGTTQCLRTNKQTGNKEPVDCPSLATHYMGGMRGTDHGDQLKMEYGLEKVFCTFKP